MDAERHAQPTGRLCASFAGHVAQALKLDVSVERSSPRGYAFFVPLGGGDSRLRPRPDFHRTLIVYQNRRVRARRFYHFARAPDTHRKVGSRQRWTPDPLGPVGTTTRPPEGITGRPTEGTTDNPLVGIPTDPLRVLPPGPLRVVPTAPQGVLPKTPRESGVFGNRVLISVFSR